MAEPPPVDERLHAGRPRCEPVIDFAGHRWSLWTYFTAGFVIFFAPVYLCAACSSRDRERAFQRSTIASTGASSGSCRA